MIAFLQSLLDHGLATVDLTPPEPATADELHDLLREFDLRQRAHFPGEAPPLHEGVAKWAAWILAHVAHFIAARDSGAKSLDEVLNEPCPVPRSPSVDYSADLFFHHLPELLKIATRLAPDDPLVTHIQRIGGEWPLSSPGMFLEKWHGLRPILQSPALLLAYADRILETEDLSRLDEPVVRRAVEDALGAHVTLSPKVARHLHLPAVDVPI